MSIYGQTMFKHLRACLISYTAPIGFAHVETCLPTILFRTSSTNNKLNPANLRGFAQARVSLPRTPATVLEFELVVLYVQGPGKKLLSKRVFVCDCVSVQQAVNGLPIYWDSFQSSSVQYHSASSRGLPAPGARETHFSMAAGGATV